MYIFKTLWLGYIVNFTAQLVEFRRSSCSTSIWRTFLSSFSKLIRRQCVGEICELCRLCNVYVCVCVSAWVWCGICGVTLCHSLFAWPVLCPRVNQSWCRHLRRLRSKLIFKNCALKCHINYVTYLRAKPPPPEVGPAYRVCDRWEREREM